MKIPELLRRFLAERDALTLFERNVAQQRGNRVNPTDIVTAFDWSATPEGFDYWNALSEQFAKLAGRNNGCYGDDLGRAE